MRSLVNRRKAKGEEKSYPLLTETDARREIIRILLVIALCRIRCRSFRSTFSSGTVEVKFRPIEGQSWRRAPRMPHALPESPLCVASTNRLSLRWHCALVRLSYRAIFGLCVIDESAPVEANLS